MKEFEGIKDAKVRFSTKNQAFTSLIPSNSFIPNSNKNYRLQFNGKNTTIAIKVRYFKK
jgi:hypothetical protein